MAEHRFRKLIGPALFEAGFVVFGVVLALAANEWRQANAERQQARTALAEIVDELQANRQAVAAAGDYHRGLITQIRTAAERNETLSARDFSRGFIAPAQVYRTAWSSASDIGAVSNMDYEAVLALSRIYALQDSYRDQANSVGEIIYSELFRGGTEAIVANAQNLGNVINTFAYREQQMLSAYDEVLAHPAIQTNS